MPNNIGKFKTPIGVVETLKEGDDITLVSYGSTLRLVEQAAKEQADIMSDPLPLVIFDDFGDSSLIFEVYFWVNATVERDLRVIRSNIRFRIDELFEENDIVISFPQRDVHIDGAITIRSEDQANGPHDMVGKHD